MITGRAEKIAFLAVSWAAYVAFYLCRKNLSIILPIFARDHLYTTSQISRVVLFFSVAYCAGQFVMGGLADRFGGRTVVLGGMILSATVTIAMALSSGFGALLACQTINGAAQAGGWVGLMKMMKQYPMRKSGVAMGWWSTNYVLGGFLAVLLATYALGSSWWMQAAWRNAALLPAVLLLLFAVIFFFATQKTAGNARRFDSTLPAGYGEVIRAALTSGRLRTLMGAYFFVKLIRYSLLFWLPLYLASHLEMTPVAAGYTSSQLEGCGVIGVVAAGYLSDYVFRARRFPVALILMALLSAVCIVASQLGAASSTWHVGLIVALLGWATYGADTILVGAAARDAARPEHMGTIAGLVDGAGSIGQVVSPLLIAFVSAQFGWPSVFRCLAVVSALCCVVLIRGLKWERQANLRAV